MTDKSSQETDQAPPPAESEQQTLAEAIPKPVFIMRAPGMPFEEFKKVCIQRFKDAGLLTDEPAPSRKRRRSAGKAC